MRRERRLSRCPLMYVTFVLIAFVWAGCGSGEPVTTTGSEISTELRKRLGDTQGAPVRDAYCPNERLVEGDTVTCRIVFGDGSYRDFDVTVGERDGDVHLEIDVAR